MRKVGIKTCQSKHFPTIRLFSAGSLCLFFIFRNKRLELRQVPQRIHVVAVLNMPEVPATLLKSGSQRIDGILNE